MQVLTERLPDAVARVSVTIDQSELVGAMDKAFKRVVGRYNVPGFRRGKVPRPIFERMVGQHVILEAAAEDLIQDRYPSALAEAGVRPVTEPKIAIETLSLDSPLKFVIEVEAKPEIEVGDVSDLLRDPLTIPEVTDDRIDEELKSLAEAQAQLVPADDEPVQDGNQVVLKIRGYLEEESGGEASEPFVEDDDYTVRVGSGTAVEGLEAQLVGLKVGEPTTIRLTYPDGHPDRDLAGKPVRFEITVVENKRPDVPPIDDELAKALNFDSLAGLREEVAKRLAERLEKEAKDERYRAILGKLKERVGVDIPSKLVDDAIHQLLHEVQSSLATMDVTLEQYLETRQMDLDALHEDLRPQAEEQVKEQLILEAVAKAQGIQVEDEEVIESLQQVAALYRQPLTNVIQLFRQQGEFERLRERLAAEKAVDYLASTVVA